MEASIGRKGLIDLTLLIFAYLTLNTSLNLLNKWTLGHYGLTYPLALTCAHMSFSFVVLAPFAVKVPYENHKEMISKQWQGLLCIGSMLAFSIALNNISLSQISLSLNQIIRSSIPVVTCLLSVFVEGYMPSRREALSLLILTVGVMIAVWQGTINGKPYAILLCVMSTFTSAAMLTFSGKLLSERLDVVHLVFYTAPISLSCLLPFAAWTEIEGFQQYFRDNRDSTILILLASSSIALMYNIVHSWMIKECSAVTTTVLGEIKIVGLLISSSVILGEGKEMTLQMVIGGTLAVMGFIMYSHTRIW